jgi:hypothetical protein
MTGKVVNLKALRDSMFVWNIHNSPTIESYELSRILGYVQWSSLRKQILTDWEYELVAGDDYYLVHDSVTLRSYEAGVVASGHLSGRAQAPVKSERGYLFITGVGLKKILSKSTKTNVHAFRADVKDTFIEVDTNYEFVDTDDFAVDISTVREQPAPKPTEFLADRKFNYEVLQTLLKQLQEMTDPVMREIAIAAAEEATGRDFTHLRQPKTVSTPSPVMPTPVFSEPKLVVERDPLPPLRITSGPMFDEEGFYSLKAIGAKAGGYSPNTAGKAANVVAGRMGYSPEQIRRTQLSFNDLPVLKDTNGRPRQMFRFAKNFSNEVVMELRINSRFQPTPQPNLPSLSFAHGEKPPNLSAPFTFGDDEDDVDSDHIESIVETLQGHSKH